MSLRKVFSAVISLSLTCFDALLVASSAHAAVAAQISPSSTFSPSSPTSAFSVTIPAPGVSMTVIDIMVDIREVGNPANKWSLASGCTTASTTLSGCNVSSFTVAGAPGPVDTYAMGSLQKTITLKRPFNGGQQFFSIGATDPVVISFSAGAFTAPASSSTQYEVYVFYNPSGGTPLTATAPVTIQAPSTYDVTFDANGGTGTMATQSASTSTALTSNAFSKTGFTFGGWASSQANATAGTVAYANGAPYAFTSSTTLYAIWTASGGLGGGSSSGSSSSSATLANTGSNTDLATVAAGILALLGALLLISRSRTSWAR